VVIVINCFSKYDPWLVMWAAIICVVAVSAGLGAYHRAVIARGSQRLTWVVVQALLLGSGAWATHFMAMLAYHSGMQVAFGPGLTSLSLIIPIAGIGLGGAIAVMNPRTWLAALGGGICGSAIALMHFVGVFAMELPARVAWNPALIATAIVIGVGSASAGFYYMGDFRSPWQRATSTTLLVLAICGLHFTAMAATSFVPDGLSVPAGALSTGILAIGVGIFTFLILAAGFGMLVIGSISTRASAAYIRSALDCAPSPLAVYDHEARLMFWNQQYAEMLSLNGLTAAPGLRFKVVIDAASAHGLPNTAALLALSGPEPEGTLREGFLTHDGRWIQPRMAAAPEGGFVVLLTDVTENIELATREALAREVAEHANRAKTEFLANVSHEIRTPLNGILGMAQVMRAKSIDPKQRDQFALIDQSGKSLLQILDSVLDISRIEAGHVELASRRFDLEQTVTSAMLPYQSQATQAGIVLSVIIAPSARGVWKGDSDRLSQVMANLISNALKFTAKGMVEAIVSVEHEGLRFEIRDTGIGIPADKLELIFQTFTQVDASATRQFGGAGLGLAISRQLVSLMGGELSVSSQEGVGSNFTFSIPIAREAIAIPDLELGGEIDQEYTGGNLRILAAEDNSTNRLILEALLEPLGVNLTMVENGREAVILCKLSQFDVILMDIQMPEMDGIDATAAIRDHELTHHCPRTPIIALTANVMRHQTDTYFSAGMDGFVAKPIDMRLLMAAIDQVLPALQAPDHPGTPIGPEADLPKVA
jgi:signal transduction histidine kinase